MKHPLHPSALEAVPPVDKGLAGGVIERHLRLHGERRRPVQWFLDANSARAYAPAAQFLASPGFPSAAAYAAACADAWHAGDTLLKRDSLAWGRKRWELVHQDEHRRVPAIESMGALLSMFAAGVFYCWIGPDEVLCIVRPSLWVVGGRLDRANGPAVEWPTGERYWFWRGVEVPNWFIEQPGRITLELIRSERNVELRRCMIERFGQERFLRETGAELVAEDAHGKLWRSELADERPYTLLEVKNGTLESDGTRRLYFLRVPPEMRTPRQAAAWTYGLSPAQYEVAVRT
jgi:hypothetical protein